MNIPPALLELGVTYSEKDNTLKLGVDDKGNFTSDKTQIKNFTEIDLTGASVDELMKVGDFLRKNGLDDQLLNTLLGLPPPSKDAGKLDTNWTIKFQDAYESAPFDMLSFSKLLIKISVELREAGMKDRVASMQAAFTVDMKSADKMLVAAQERFNQAVANSTASMVGGALTMGAGLAAIGMAAKSFLDTKKISLQSEAVEIKTNLNNLESKLSDNKSAIDGINKKIKTLEQNPFNEAEDFKVLNKQKMQLEGEAVQLDAQIAMKKIEFKKALHTANDKGAFGGKLDEATINEYQGIDKNGNPFKTNKFIEDFEALRAKSKLESDIVMGINTGFSSGVNSMVSSAGQLAGAAHEQAAATADADSKRLQAESDKIKTQQQMAGELADRYMQLLSGIFGDVHGYIDQIRQLSGTISHIISA